MSRTHHHKRAARRPWLRGYTLVRAYKTAAELGLTENELREHTIIAMEIREELEREEARDRRIACDPAACEAAMMADDT